MLSVYTVIDRNTRATAQTHLTTGSNRVSCGGLKPSSSWRLVIFYSTKPGSEAVTDNPSYTSKPNSQAQPDQQVRVQSHVIGNGEDTGQHNTKRQAGRYTNQAPWMRQVAPS